MLAAYSEYSDTVRLGDEAPGQGSFLVYKAIFVDSQNGKQINMPDIKGYTEL